LPVDDGQPAFFRLRGVDQHAFHSGTFFSKHSTCPRGANDAGLTRSETKGIAGVVQRTPGGVEFTPAGEAVSHRQKVRIDNINTKISLQSVREQGAPEPVFRIGVSWRRIGLRACVPLSAGASSLQAMRASGIDLPAPLGVKAGLNSPIGKQLPFKSTTYS
jgi:hypothetical protein